MDGNSVVLDELQNWDYGGSFKALYVGLDDKGTVDTADDRYALAVKKPILIIGMAKLM